MNELKKTMFLFLVLTLGYSFIGISLLEAQTIQLVSEVISPSVILNASNGKIEKTFGTQQFVGARPPGCITDIEWSPDGKRIAVARIDEMWTVHYPEDIWIIERDGKSAKKVTNSELYKVIGEDSDIATLRSTYYDTPRWTNNGNYLVISVETIDRVEDKRCSSDVPSLFLCKEQ